DLSTLSEEQRDIVTRVLDGVDAKRPVREFYTGHAYTGVVADFILNRGMTPEEAWTFISVVMSVVMKEEESDTP
ncbi:MAG TPA: hypothetical protein PLB67_18120, partial [Candidatus Hydrogenedentes bacterium]|nr:hypothetical protein [Candidatus Hydrogenedentota bacterium]